MCVIFLIHVYYSLIAARDALFNFTTFRWRFYYSFLIDHSVWIDNIKRQTFIAILVQ